MKRKDRKKQNVVWVDISQDEYQAADHANIDYATAMGAMHVIDKNGKVRFCCNFALLFCVFAVSFFSWNMSKFRFFFSGIQQYRCISNYVQCSWIRMDLVILETAWNVQSVAKGLQLVCVYY